MRRGAHQYYYSGWRRSGVPMGKAFDPASLFAGGEAGAVYDFSNLSTLYQEIAAGGTTPSSVNGVIGTARDLSGLGNHWVAPIDAARPMLRLSSGIYYADTDGVDDRMTATVAMALPVTRVSCIRQPAWSTGERIFHGGVGNSYLGQNNSTPQIAHFNATWAPSMATRQLGRSLLFRNNLAHPGRPAPVYRSTTRRQRRTLAHIAITRPYR